MNSGFSQKNMFIALVMAILLGTISIKGNAQETKKKLTLQEVINLARNQSLEAMVAKHKFLADYWEYRSYKAKYLPDLTLRTEFPNFNRSIEKYQNPDGSYTYVEDNINTSSLNLDIYQNIGVTGGQLFVNTDLQRIDQFGDNRSHSYRSTPVSIGYRQPTLLYNKFKWEKKIEPVKYEEAKKQYLANLEDVTLKAVNYYFDLILAQKNLEIAESNYANADTLYKISKKRFKIGTIAENELMQMKLSFLNAGSNLNDARINLKSARIKLRSFLGYNDKVEIKLIPPKDVPELSIEVEKAISMAKKNNPEIISYEKQLIQSKRDVAKAKAEKGLNADLFASFGLTQKAGEFSKVYDSPQNQESFNLGLEIPILDWGEKKGQYKMAKSRREVVKTDIQRSKTEFMQNVSLKVMKFNLQDDQVDIQEQAKTTAQKRYKITKKRFMVGKVDVLDLNVASKEKDVAKRNYISALRSYWTDYYQIRKTTLFNFIEDHPIKTQYENLIE
jgi:outer membrane protein TolC